MSRQARGRQGAEDHRHARRTPAAPGLDHITVDYGDQLADVADARRPATATGAGKFTLKVAAVDKAGNVARKQVKLRIKKS